MALKKFDEDKNFRREKFKKTEKRIQIRENRNLEGDIKQGKIVGSAGRFWMVEPLDYLETGISEKIICTISGAIQKNDDEQSLATIGDNVGYIKIENNSGLETEQGAIVSIEERKTVLLRKEIHYSAKERAIAANFDYLAIVASLDNPPYNKRLIDRYLLSAELGRMNCVILANKIDIFEDLSVFKEDLEIYKKLGIEIFWISALKNIGITKFKNFIKQNSCILGGFSGAGKSSIINALVKEDVQKIGDISKKWNKGKHVTSSSSIFRLSNGGIICDTPGIREFAPPEVDKARLSFYFKDIAKFAAHCKYLPCSHTHEPNCRVIEAVDNEELDFERYQSYLNIYNSIED